MKSTATTKIQPPTRATAAGGEKEGRTKTAARTIAANTIDDVRGVIIGDNRQGALFYDGRQQGKNLYGESDEEIIEKGKALRNQLVAELGGYPCYLYQQPELWEVRIYR